MLLDDLRKEISCRREELSSLETALDILERDHANGLDRPRTRSPKSIRSRVIIYLGEQGPNASVTTDQLAEALDLELNDSLKANLTAMSREGMIEKLPLPNTWRMKT